MNDYYTDIILQRGEREACDLLVDECRKKDIAIAILKTDLDKERSEAERLRDRQPQGRRGGEMNDHVHDCSKCNGYWPCDRDDCSPDDLCVDCRLEQKDAEIASLISDADTSNQTPSVAQNQTWYNPDTRETKLFDGKKWIKI